MHSNRRYYSKESLHTHTPMQKPEIDLYVGSTYLCTVSGWCLFPSKFIFRFFHWSWVLAGLMASCLKTTFPILPCGWVWPRDFVFIVEPTGDNVYNLHKTCLKEVPCPKLPLLHSCQLAHRWGANPTFKRQSSKMEGNCIPELSHRALPAQP